MNSAKKENLEEAIWKLISLGTTLEVIGLLLMCFPLPIQLENSMFGFCLKKKKIVSKQIFV